MRRIALLLSFAVLAATATAGAQPPSVRSWAAPQIETVVAAGLMAPSVTNFRPDDLLTSSELATALSSLGAEATVADDPFRLVTVREPRRAARHDRRPPPAGTRAPAGR